MDALIDMVVRERQINALIDMVVREHQINALIDMVVREHQINNFAFRFPYPFFLISKYKCKHKHLLSCINNPVSRKIK